MALPTAERRARAATDTARALLAADDVAGAFARLQQVEAAAPQEARRPSVRALTDEVAARRPGLPGLAAFTRRTAAGRLSAAPQTAEGAPTRRPSPLPATPPPPALVSWQLDRCNAPL
ncbi:hypothetical protein H1V43_38220 [Streptomyces sp. PSKA54]|uniref:Uncharacterized protein n=1 Tax=Streptomyces himalayensis subsp. aureolus TaxID=2758039 RepID=A0A7W2HKC7_9ACTN|nr:hypothetical protein [Streptomyces himalayensis]MBA4867031.1 hypothetical protein [Streptomyces himalayensis subsp. aureolus]